MASEFAEELVQLTRMAAVGAVDHRDDGEGDLGFPKALDSLPDLTMSRRSVPIDSLRESRNSPEID
jgi:hypothetical protein